MVLRWHWRKILEKCARLTRTNSCTVGLQNRPAHTHSTHLCPCSHIGTSIINLWSSPVIYFRPYLTLCAPWIRNVREDSRCLAELKANAHTSCAARVLLDHVSQSFISPRNASALSPSSCTSFSLISSISHSLLIPMERLKIAAKGNVGQLPCSVCSERFSVCFLPAPP